MLLNAQISVSRWHVDDVDVYFINTEILPALTGAILTKKRAKKVSIHKYTYTW